MSRLAKSFALLLSFAGLLLLFSPSAFAAAYFTRVAGPVNWNANGSWSTVACGGASAGAAYPGSTNTADTATICPGNTITLTAAPPFTIASLTFTAGATPGNLTMTGQTLTVSGAVSMTAPTVNSTSILNVDTGTLNAGSIAITGANGSRIAQVTVSTGTITTTGNITFAGTAANAQFVSTGASMVNVGGNFASGGTLTTTNTGTINFNGTVAAQSMGTYTTYNNVTIANTNIAGVVTMLGNSSMTGALTVTSGTLAKNTRTLGVAGNLVVNGAITGTTGNITLSGTAATIDGTGSITTTTGILSITTAKTILATANLTIASPTTLSAATTVTNNGIINKTTTAALTGANATTSIWVNAAGSTLNYAGTNAPMATGVLNASATGNTVNYNGAGQTVEPPGGATPAYYRLTLSGSAAKTMGATAINGNFTMSGAATTAPTGALTVGGNFTIGTGTTFTAGTFNHTVSGNFDATGTFTNTGSTVTLNGATAQTISGANPVAFNNLAVSAVSPNITLATNVTVVTVTTGTVTLTSTCPIDYTLISTTPAQVLHSCPPVTPPANFDCVETGVTYTPNPVSPTRNPLYTKLAGTAFSFDVVALKADGTVETTYASTGNKDVTVELVDGAGATVCASRTILTPAISQTLTFTAANLGRKTTASMTVGKAYADLRCRVTDVATSIKGCSADNFSVRPGAATLTTTANAVGPSATATPVIKAGTAFTIGATTTTGATDAYTGTLTLDTTKLTAQLPSNGSTQQSGGAVGSLTVSPAVQANASPAQSNNATWNEVGYLYAAAGAFRDDGYTSVDQPLGCAATNSCDCVTDTVGNANLADTFDVNNKIGCSIGNKIAVSFGRFIPDHFDVATSSNGTMTAACASGSFTYTGQAMGYGALPSLTIKAINAATGVIVTQNYQGVFQKLAAANVTITAPTADGTQNGKDGVTKTVLAASMSAGTLANSSGTLTYTLAAGDQYIYTRDANSLVGAYTSNIPLVVASVSDGEVVSAGTLPTLNPTGVSLRFGRLKLSNAYGSELLNLSVPIQTQYWNGTAFVINAADNCTALVANNIKLTSPPPGVSATVGGAFSSGAGSLTLTKPTPAAKGVVALCVDLDSGATGDTTCQAAIPAAKLYLQTGAAYDKDPTAQATFGVYKGSNQFIYMRENY
ncbi:MAG TPA: DUF6701 domain-containing protein [Gallionella sp.]|nr:DUF6701 domain-containing protein [Gallionella sp.]